MSRVNSNVNCFCENDNHIDYIWPFVVTVLMLLTMGEAVYAWRPGVCEDGFYFPHHFIVNPKYSET